MTCDCIQSGTVNQWQRTANKCVWCKVQKNTHDQATIGSGCPCTCTSNILLSRLCDFSNQSWKVAVKRKLHHIQFWTTLNPLNYFRWNCVKLHNMQSEFLLHMFCTYIMLGKNIVFNTRKIHTIHVFFSPPLQMVFLTCDPHVEFHAQVKYIVRLSLWTQGDNKNNLLTVQLNAN